MSYLPRSESELTPWLNNFVTKLSAHAAAVGVTATELATAQADVAYLSYLLHELLPAYRAKAQEITAYKDLIKDGPIGTPGGPVPAAPVVPVAPVAVEPGVLQRLQGLVQRIKNAPGYNAAIGADLGVEAPVGVGAIGDGERPKFKLVALTGGRVRIEWVKGKSDGVRIESRRGPEQDFSRLDDDRFSPYVDERPVLKIGETETRQYRLRYLKKDEPVGVYSDIATVVTLS